MSKINAGDNEWIEKLQEKISLLSGINSINILRLNKLKDQYPENIRIDTLGKRAVKCIIDLYDIANTANERLFSLEMRPQIQAENRKMMDMVKKMYSIKFPIT